MSHGCRKPHRKKIMENFQNFISQERHILISIEGAHLKSRRHGAKFKVNKNTRDSLKMLDVIAGIKSMFFGVRSFKIKKFTKFLDLIRF